MHSGEMHTHREKLLRWVLTYVLMPVLAYFTLYTGIRGLRYFINFPAEGRIAWLLLPHIGAGFIALIVGPWQFWPWLRMKYQRLHRWMGRIYIVSVGISSIPGLYLAVTNPNLHFRAGITGLALAWIVTGSLGYLTIRKGLVQEHREWMILNYVLTWSFVTFRVVVPFMKGLGYAPGDTLIFTWLCWVPQLLITSLILRMNQSKLLAKPPKLLTKKRYRFNPEDLNIQQRYRLLN